MQVRYDLDRFAAEGGERHQNRDGWGIVLTEDRDAHYFREAAPASDSELDRFVREHAKPHATIIAHVRRASQGRRTLTNTHPFRRVYRGRVHHFAHNGTLEGIERQPDAKALMQHRVGDTDSELAFLLLLDRLERNAPDASEMPVRFDVFRTFCRDMAALGPANFLWLDEDMLFVHADRRVFETEEGLSPPRPPGLHVFRPEPGTLRERHECTGAILDNPPDRVVLFASLPLSEASWEPLEQGTVIAVAGGQIVRQERNKARQWI